MAKEKGRTPDWNLSAMEPNNVCKGKIGGGWNNDDGSISIKLNPFVTLRAIDDVRLRLFPYERLSDAEFAEKQRKREEASAATPSRSVRSYPDDSDDDIPF